jgi:pimeloyl-ACP methyl ester carboxylesterase
MREVRRTDRQYFCSTGGRMRRTAGVQSRTGTSDFCDAPSESEGLEAHFTGGYQRFLLDGVGHFPHREAPVDVTAVILRHLGM